MSTEPPAYPEKQPIPGGPEGESQSIQGGPPPPPQYGQPNPPYPGYPQGPPQGYPGQPQMQQPTTANVIYVQSHEMRFNKYPAQIQCPSCHNAVTTQVTPVNGLLTWLACGGACLFGCWLGCCLIPFCIDDLKDFEHRCPNCHSVVSAWFNNF